MGKIIQNGVIYTGTGSGGGGGASSVDQLTDVQLTTPTTGDELVYNSSLTSPYKWENKKLTWTGTQAQYDLIATPDPDVTYYITDASPLTANLGSLADVVISNVADENNLRYNATSGKWENKSDFIVKNSLGTTVFNVYGNPSNHNGEVIVYDSNGTARNLIGNGNHYICNSSGNLVAAIGTIGNYVNLDFYDSLDLSSKSISMYGDTGLIQCKGISTGSGTVTLSSKTAASGGTDLSLVTTGEKYSWNNLANQVKELRLISQTFSLSANSSITIQANSTRIMCLLYGTSDSEYVRSIAYLIGGYVTASRCTVTNLTGLTGVTINSSSTTDMKFVITNTQNFTVPIYIYNLIGEGFTLVT